jgi:hypothetical protein
MKNFTLVFGFLFLSSWIFANSADSTIFKYNLQAQPNVVLDVALKSFDALPLSNQVFLNWVTASEANNAFFVIERSKDGIHFEALAEVKGMGNSEVPIYYDFVDESPLAAFSFYRLKQIDKSGSFSYGPVLKVYSLHANLVHYYDSKQAKKWALEFDAPQATEVEIKLYNKRNELVFSENRRLDKGMQLIPLDINHLKKGRYRLELKSPQSEYQKALRIQP